MKLHIKSVILLAAAVLAGGCVDDDLQVESGIDVPGDNGDGSLLQLAVESYEVSVQNGSKASEPSNVPEPESEDEKRIQDFWMFQFKPDGTQLAAPKYYEIVEGETGKGTLKELTATAYADLTRNTPMTIYIVTNTHNSTWATGTGFNTLEGVKSQKLPSPVLPIRAGRDDEKVLIPMSGQLDNVTVTDKTLVVVPVIRMYAKIKVNVEFNVQNMELYYALVSGIPSYSRVTTDDKGVDGNGEPLAVPLPDNTEMLSRAFRSTETISDSNGKWMVIYVPENIRGEVTGADKTKVPAVNVPENALAVNINAKYDGMEYIFTVYPGENNTNNFNVRRNRVYRVSANVIGATDQHNPSSNCFIVKPGQKLQFEPYNRVEKGGDYDISTYLDPAVPNLTIDKIEIIWQTKNCIGDNTKGDLVYLGPDTGDKHRKIIVNAGEEGNALIAARNSSGTIIWSWHIWVTKNEPDNLANAVVYTTYRWDSNGIHGGKNAERIPGYSIMPCNLGALAFRSLDDMPNYSISPGRKFPDSQIRTFGMLYQWGRKDPFPPMIYSTGTEDSNGTLGYTDDYTEIHYANDNRTVVHKTSGFQPRVNIGDLLPNYVDCLFYSQLGDDHRGTVKYSIENPTIYIAGTSRASTANETFANDGDWCRKNESDNRLWGASESYTTALNIYSKGSIVAHLYDNYGEKSIFDPCPTGWRVPPGDLWFGFTESGYNPVEYEEENKPKYFDQVNYNEDETKFRPGMSMYVQKWKDGPTVYFPLQGIRVYNGKLQNVGLCGNYHTATCDVSADLKNRVNLLHLHRDMSIVSSSWTSLKLFTIFEYEHKQYYSKSTAGPIRCVRDRK